jgi:hypothetical protein
VDKLATLFKVVKTFNTVAPLEFMYLLTKCLFFLVRVIGVSQLVISILTSLWVYLILVRELNVIFKSLKVQILRLILFIVFFFF